MRLARVAVGERQHRSERCSSLIYQYLKRLVVLMQLSLHIPLSSAFFLLKAFVVVYVIILRRCGWIELHLHIFTVSQSKAAQKAFLLILFELLSLLDFLFIGTLKIFPL